MKIARICKEYQGKKKIVNVWPSVTTQTAKTPMHHLTNSRLPIKQNVGKPQLPLPHLQLKPAVWIIHIINVYHKKTLYLKIWPYPSTTEGYGSDQLATNPFPDRDDGLWMKSDWSSVKSQLLQRIHKLQGVSLCPSPSSATTQSLRRRRVHARPTDVGVLAQVFVSSLFLPYCWLSAAFRLRFQLGCATRRFSRSLKQFFFHSKRGGGAIRNCLSWFEVTGLLQKPMRADHRPTPKPKHIPDHLCTPSNIPPFSLRHYFCSLQRVEENYPILTPPRPLFFSNSQTFLHTVFSD